MRYLQIAELCHELVNEQRSSKMNDLLAMRMMPVGFKGAKVQKEAESKRKE